MFCRTYSFASHSYWLAVAVIVVEGVVMGFRRGERFIGPYEIIMSHPVYENPWLKLREDRVRLRSGEDTTFGIVTMKPGVTVLPVQEDGAVSLVREFKYALGEESLEAVSGAIESGETPEQAGLRELSEEAGLIAAEWLDMGLINPFTTLVHSPNHMFLARKLKATRRTLDEGEHIEIVTMPFEEALERVLQGRITHGATCVLLLKTKLFLSRKSLLGF